MLTEGEDIADALFVNGPSCIHLSTDLLLKVLKDRGCVNLVCPCIVVCGSLRVRPVPVGRREDSLPPLLCL